MSTIRICTPVTGANLEAFVDNLKKVQQISDFIELRVDTIKGFKVDDILTIKKLVKKDAIFTCRKKEEGGFFEGTEPERANILQKAIMLHFQHVDIELSTINEFTFVSNRSTKIIISYHDFKQTPSYWDMNKIIFEINRHKPDILKLATMVNEEHENTKLYRLLTNKPHTEERIIIGMGEKGRMSRIIGPLLGSYLTFAATPYSQSAPGQVPMNELKEIYHQLKVIQ